MSPDSPDVPDVSLTNIRAASTLPDQLIARVIPRVRLNVSIIRWDDDVSSKKNKKNTNLHWLLLPVSYCISFCSS